MSEGAVGRAATAALIPLLTQTLGGSMLEAVSAADMDEAAILPAGVLPAVEILRRGGFNYLLDIGGTDHLPLTPRFEISYHFQAFPTDDGAVEFIRPSRFRLRVFPDDLDPVIPSLTSLWPNADWAEREVWDLFGVSFDGHPDLRRILMPDDWQGHPLRKDYPLRGLERRFSPGGRGGPVPPVITQ